MADPQSDTPLVEQVPEGQAWVRAGRPYRPKISLRESDEQNMTQIRFGTGMSEAAANRLAYQIGLAVLRIARLLGVDWWCLITVAIEAAGPADGELLRLMQDLRKSDNDQ